MNTFVFLIVVCIATYQVRKYLRKNPEKAVEMGNWFKQMFKSK